MFAIRYRKIFLTIAGILMVGSFILIATLGLRMGIDFAGGSLTEVSYTTVPEKTSVESEVETMNLGNFSVRESVDDTGKDGYLIRTRDLTEPERESLVGAVTTLGEGGEVTRFTSIGPVIGQELRDKAVWAISAVALIIILYIAFAFSGIGKPVSSWVYGGITIFVLIHDILIPTALMSVLGYVAGIEIDVLFVMALLAILGYSVNDTIVIFDRVRENLLAHRTEKRTKRNEAGIIKEEVEYTLTKPYEELVGTAINQTIARSINTSLTTLLTLSTLYFIGGSVTQTFALILIAGVVAGTYSSICIANPLLVSYAKWQDGRQKDEKDK